VDWVDFAFKGEKPEVSEEVGNFFDWVIFVLPILFLCYNSDSFIRLSVKKEVESDSREEN
jgi:hypothetical protein